MDLDLKAQIDPNRVPSHVAVIMDGNGRWAREKGKERIFGHRNAIRAVRETVECAAEIGVKNLTLYAFSTENWKRPRLEVNALMELLVSSLAKELQTLIDNDIRLLAIGNLDSLPKRAAKTLQANIKKTENHQRMNLVLALSYSARWEILEAVKRIVGDARDNRLTEADINEETFSSYLSTAGLPDPELMIRTSGEYRISNFLLWQLSYAELSFVEKFWPDFRKEDLMQAIIEYQKRERRFGRTGDQISALRNG